jgi:hypothetical protein
LIFKKAWDRIEVCSEYRGMRAEWKLWYG